MAVTGWLSVSTGIEIQMKKSSSCGFSSCKKSAGKLYKWFGCWRGQERRTRPHLLWAIKIS